MKYAIIILNLFCCLSLSLAKDNKPDFMCYYGFSFEISTQRSWGYQQPVILSVFSESPAAKAGLRVNDIIEEINGVSTLNQPLNVVTDWLYDASYDEIILTVSNYSGKNRSIRISKECYYSNAVKEKDLADSYSFFSLRDVQKRSFAYPLKTKINTDLDLLGYRTFAIEYDASNQIEKSIYRDIKQALTDKGLIYSEQNPDLKVYTYYTYDKNLNFNPEPGREKLLTASRLNIRKHVMDILPIYYNPEINSTQAEYLIHFGIMVADSRLSNDDQLYVVWECEVNEMLKQSYPLQDYLEFHIPMILMQYPYPRSNEESYYYFNRLRYNYTGIIYDMNSPGLVLDVEERSPARLAGIEPGDVIEKVNGIRFADTEEESARGYREFIYNTIALRDPRTQYTNAYGFSHAMFWHPDHYSKVAKEVRKGEYNAAYSYLFCFEPYINPNRENTLSLDIKRRNSKLSLEVKPKVVIEENFYTIPSLNLE